MVAVEKDVRTDELVINMGPQHPSTHGVLRVVLKTDGEMCLDAQPDIGYLHRCAEKIAENLPYGQFVPYTDRMDYVSGMGCNMGYCMAVEQVAGIQVPERGEWLRVIVTELNRIASHLLAFGTYGLDTGAITPFLYGFRERELVLDLLEMLCGARLTYSYIRIGGVDGDVPPEFMDKLKEFLDIFPKKIREYNKLLTYNHIFMKRTVGVGVLPADVAIAYGVTGPCLRGSGVRQDVRRDEPYSVYPKLEFDVPVGTDEHGPIGDAWNRYYIRIRELEESAKILRQCVKMISPGPVLAEKVGRVKPPAGAEAYTRSENARGELGFYIVSDGTMTPARVKVRAPSFSNISVLPAIVRGQMLADVVAIIGSLDIVLGEIDR
ncbi:MAG: NADH dehydrogenase [Candidatus Lindowbacteria bacterium RIFCSPLOWO2_12_FULL_62_27]|nr:MAG: NADH dehydrogenase [Candidatus Lindowbacteria bacterium RIFCSPLOWO2_12_FULL_62_27]OGH64017.1 MAG: NADH dehydrogenase [Candidatus Lindowbacteria bacterium RIFCSPLOWO2_02_FULL_62_12]